MKTAFVSIFLLSSLSSFALDVPHVCEVKDLSLAQKTELQKINLEVKEKIKLIKVDVNAAKDLLNRILQNPQAIKEDAAEAQALLKAKSAEISAILANKKVIELFDILTPEQRVKKSKCIASLSNSRRPHRPQRPVVIRPVATNRCGMPAQRPVIISHPIPHSHSRYSRPIRTHHRGPVVIVRGGRRVRP